MMGLSRPPRRSIGTAARRRGPPARPGAALPYMPSPSVASSDHIDLPRHALNWPYGPVGDRIKRVRMGVGIDAEIARIYDRAGLLESAIDTAGARHHKLIRQRDGKAVRL